MEKQTAIDYIEENLFWPIKFNELLMVLDEAKAIEKQQIKDAYCKGVNDADNHNMGEKIDWENYYNKTYLKQNDNG